MRGKPTISRPAMAESALAGPPANPSAGCRLGRLMYFGSASRSDSDPGRSEIDTTGAGAWSDRVASSCPGALLCLAADPSGPTSHGSHNCAAALGASRTCLLRKPCGTTPRRSQRILDAWQRVSLEGLREAPRKATVTSHDHEASFSTSMRPPLVN